MGTTYSGGCMGVVDMNGDGLDDIAKLDKKFSHELFWNSGWPDDIDAYERRIAEWSERLRGAGDGDPMQGLRALNALAQELARAGDRCAALAGGALVDGAYTAYHCTIYPDRPRTCRDFTLGSEHCLTARRRVGLSL